MSDYEQKARNDRQSGADKACKTVGALAVSNDDVRSTLGLKTMHIT